jgi:hypothetical protein
VATTQPALGIEEGEHLDQLLCSCGPCDQIVGFNLSGVVLPGTAGRRAWRDVLCAVHLRRHRL